MQTLVTTLKPSVTPSWHAQRGLNRVRSGTKGGRAQEAGQRKGKGSSAKTVRTQWWRRRQARGGGLSHLRRPSMRTHDLVEVARFHEARGDLDVRGGDGGDGRRGGCQG